MDKKTVTISEQLDHIARQVAFLEKDVEQNKLKLEKYVRLKNREALEKSVLANLKKIQALKIQEKNILNSIKNKTPPKIGKSIWATVGGIYQ